MQWLIPILLAAVCFGLYNFFIKLSAGHIHEILGAAVLQGVALALGATALLVLKTKGIALASSPRGMTYAVAAGVFVGLAEILSFYAFSRGLPATVGIPILVGGTVLTGGLLGLVVLKEALSPWQYLAVALILIGVIIFVMDNGQ